MGGLIFTEADGVFFCSRLDAAIYRGAREFYSG